MTGKVSRVLVIGYGEMGHAMEALLSPRHRLQFWDKRPVEPHAAVELESAVADSDFVLFCVPVTPLAGLVERVQSCLPADSISLSVAKGLDERGRPAPAILETVYSGRHDFGVLYGPMIAEEILQSRPAFAQVGCSSRAIFARVNDLFTGSGLLLEYAEDTQGIAWSSLLKNVYAILFGAADQLALGDNLRGYLVVSAIREMGEIVRTMGGRAETVQQLAGLGDLVTTATSVSSHHHSIGQSLARGETTGISGEGTHTLDMVEKFRLFDTAPYPLYRLVKLLVENPAECERNMRAFIAGLSA